MNILRLESVLPINKYDDIVNRVIFFDAISGKLNTYNIPETNIPFELSNSEISKILLKYSLNLPNGEIRIVHNKPILNAYSAPIKVFLSLTNNCQLACPFCLSSSSPKNEFFIDLDFSKRIIDEMYNIGVLKVKLDGGEPLLHPHFFDIVDYLNSKKIFVSATTNGMIINDRIAKKLKQKNVKISISLEGEEEINNILRGSNTYKRIIESISILRKYYKSELAIRTNLTSINLSEVDSILNIAKELNIKAKFNYLKPSGRAVKGFVLGFSNQLEYYNTLKVLNSENNLPYVIMDETMMFIQPDSIKTYSYGRKICGAGSKSIHISAEGFVTPCIFLSNDFPCGQLNYNENNIMDFWSANNNSIFDLRLIPEPIECIDCERLCKFECPSMRLFHSKKIDGIDPLCLKYIKEKFN